MSGLGNSGLFRVEVVGARCIPQQVLPSSLLVAQRPQRSDKRRAPSSSGRNSRVIWLREAHMKPVSDGGLDGVSLSAQRDNGNVVSFRTPDTGSGFAAPAASNALGSGARKRSDRAAPAAVSDSKTRSSKRRPDPDGPYVPVPLAERLALQEQGRVDAAADYARRTGGAR